VQCANCTEAGRSRDASVFARCKNQALRRTNHRACVLRSPACASPRLPSFSRFMTLDCQTSGAPGDQAQWIEGYFEQTSDAPARRRGRPGLGFRLYLPAVRDDDRFALLVMLHGCRQNALMFAEGTRMNRLADAHRFVVLYPEQSSGANPLRCWNWFNHATLDGDGEAGRIVRLVEHVAAQHPIDRARIWVAGMSAGAAMARILAVRYASHFVACAVHSGVMYRGARSALQAFATLRRGSHMSPESTLAHGEHPSERQTRFVPTLVIHGDRDEVVNPVNARQIVEQARLLAASEKLESLDHPHERRISANGRNYTQKDFSRAGAVVIRQITIEGLAHAWSGGDPKHPFNDAVGPSAAELIWDFLSHHRRQSQLMDATALEEVSQEGDCSAVPNAESREPSIGLIARRLNDWRRRRR
jgi:poly(hydroxyalkanoate) depolymerase family esterase